MAVLISRFIFSIGYRVIVHNLTAMKVMNQLNIKDAYIYAYRFLGRAYVHKKIDDLGALLGGMQMRADDSTFDAAMISYWKEAVMRTTNELSLVSELTRQQVHSVMVSFLNEHAKLIHSEELLQYGNSILYREWDQFMMDS